MRKKKGVGTFIMTPRVINLLIKLGGGLIVFFIIGIISHQIFKRLYKKNNGIHLKFFKSLVDVILIIITIYYCLSLFDFTKEMSTVLLQSSTLIIAIATFAAQQALGNVISGFSISITKPYKVGDKVKVVNGSNIIAEGIIMDVTIRHTVIRTFDGQSAIVPNNVMDNSVIVNTNYTANVGNFLEVEISYDSNIEKASSIVRKLCIKHELTLNEPKMKVLINRYTSNGIVLKTTVWTETLDDNFQACSDIRREIIDEFAKNNITIPYNTVTISNMN